MYVAFFANIDCQTSVNSRIVCVFCLQVYRIEDQREEKLAIDFIYIRMCLHYFYINKC